MNSNIDLASVTQQVRKQESFRAGRSSSQKSDKKKQPKGCFFSKIKTLRSSLLGLYRHESSYDEQ